MVKFKEQLKAALENEIPTELLDLLPSGFQQIGTAAIISLKEELLPYKGLIGKVILERFRYIKGVWLKKGKIVGKFRKPENLEHICGDKNTEVIHSEHGIRYAFDFTQIMFAKGNTTERAHLVELIQPDEIIVDMFAGIGYFTLGIAKHSKAKRIYAIELNPVSFKYLVKNLKLNKIKEGKVIAIHGDCKDEVPKLGNEGVKADRIIMGVFPAPFKYIEAASSVIKNNPLCIDTDFSKFVEMSKMKYKYEIYGDLSPEKLREIKTKNTIVHFEGVTMGKTIEELYNKFCEKLHEI
ncbi:MAG: class I SAM-dependent methyltransferase, partial [Promethearchaeota archaeon]